MLVLLFNTNIVNVTRKWFFQNLTHLIVFPYKYHAHSFFSTYHSTMGSVWSLGNPYFSQYTPNTHSEMCHDQQLLLSGDRCVSSITWWWNKRNSPGEAEFRNFNRHMSWYKSFFSLLAVRQYLELCIQSWKLVGDVSKIKLQTSKP